ncbi:MAG: FHIPEP family type III secretion protein [Pseudomonadota bacterium]
MDRKPTFYLALFLMAVIIMMVLPVPSYILDLGVAVSFGLAITIFVVTLFIERPLDFSSFPAMLVASLLLRLSLNVSSTKLILSEGHTGTDAAGTIIKAFSQFFMSGSLLLGVIAFTVILIVNFVVITKGATRMAEVGARFALDAMPGRQLAIDSDVAAGAITHEEARERRAAEQAEASFLGSLDGASKFVKGDAIAGLLITLLNIVAGVSVGLFVHDLSVSQAFEVYAILTVGDGLVTQIPGVIISIAAGLILARSGLREKTGSVFARQLAQFPHALLVVSVVLGVFAVTPGMPFFPFAILAGLSGFFFIEIRKHIARQNAQVTKQEKATQIEEEPSLTDLLHVDDMQLEISKNLVGEVLAPLSGLEGRIDGLRRHIVTQYGLILPKIRITDNDLLDFDEYRFLIQGVEVARARVRSHHFLTLEDVPEGKLENMIREKEPVFEADAIWIPKGQKSQANALGLNLISAVEVISTHLFEKIKENLHLFLTRRLLDELLDSVCEVSDPISRSRNRKLISELVPDRVSKELLLSILTALLEEEVSIRNLPIIIEAVSRVVELENSTDTILEKVRQSIKAQIVESVKNGQDTLKVVQLDAQWEEIFLKNSIVSKGYPQISLPPQLFNFLIGEINALAEDVASESQKLILVCSEIRRRFIFQILRSKGVNGSVLSYEEIVGERRIELRNTLLSPELELP